MQDEYPKTVQEAVRTLLSDMTEEQKDLLCNSTEEELVDFHHTLGTNIRNRFGLWEDNYELLISCGVVHPDDASRVIMQAVWQAVKGQERDS